jgi:hypothetical protein
VIDPAARQRCLQTGRSVLKQMSDLGMPCRVGDNDVLGSIVRIQNLLARSFDPSKRTVLEPRLFFFKSCERLRAQISSWHYGEKNGQSTGKPQKSLGQDDTVAAARYGVMALPHVERPELVVVSPDKTAGQKCREQAERNWKREHEGYSISPSRGYGMSRTMRVA